MKTKKILILGSRGMLGAAFFKKDISGHECIGIDRCDADLSESEAIHSLFIAYSPDIVMNCAACNDVDRMETDEAYAREAMRINAELPKLLAMLCHEKKILLIHFSTDYVFDGVNTHGYVENFAQNPVNRYGKSKAAGEKNVFSNAQRYYLIRISRLFGGEECSPNGKSSFVSSMLRLANEKREIPVVNDEFSCPTYVPDIIDFTTRLILQEYPDGIYHGSNYGVCSWYDFAESIFSAAKNEAVKIVPIPSGRLTRPARRPMRSELRNTKCPVQPHWKDALERYLVNIK